MVDALRHVRIAAAAIGKIHSLALSMDDMVLSWGSNAHGQLGLGCIGCSEQPQRVEALSGIKLFSVAAGNDSSYATAEAGELFTWGNGQYGWLGHGDTADQFAPRRVDALQGERVVAVLTGHWYTVAVTRDGGLFG